MKTETEKGTTLLEKQTESRRVSARPTEPNELSKLIEQYGCGPVQFTGTNDALYERHLVFDNVIDAAAIGARERFEALAHSVRDVLSQRWIRTEEIYDRKDPKRVYYLSMEFLIGRSLANNVTNLLLDDVIENDIQQKKINWYELLEQEPDAGLGNGGLGRLAACFLDSMATMQSRPWDTACATNTASSSKRLRTAGNARCRTTGCADRTHGKSRDRLKR